MGGFSSRNPGEIIEFFKIVNETIIEERKTEIVDNFVCDTNKPVTYQVPVSTGKKCLINTYVQKHIQNVHNQSIYSCEVCDNKFTIKANLKNHQKKVILNHWILLLYMP